MQIPFEETKPAARTGARRVPRILLADDEDDVRRAMARTLRNGGYDVLEVSDMRHFLLRVTARYYVDSEIDLVISDIRMPDATGIDLVVALRGAKWNVPLLLVTGYFDPETRDRAAAYGVSVLEKPIPRDQLLAECRSLIAN